MARFDIDFFSRDQQGVAQVVPAGMLFTLLSRRVRVPSGCAALAWAAGEQPGIVHGGTELDGDGLSRVMVVRIEPIALEYQFSGLPSNDGHEFSAILRLTVQIIPERSELGCFQRRVLAGTERVVLSHLRRHCEEPVRLSAAAFCKGKNAEGLLQVETWEQFDGALAEAFKSFGFESGLALGPDVRAEFRSPAFAEHQRQKKAEDDRKQRLDADDALRKSANEAREIHLASLGAMMEKVRSMAAAGSGVSVKDLIRTFDSGQRGELYGSLLNTSTSEKKARAILLVAGDEIFSIDPNSRKIIARRAIGNEFGPLRSVRTSMHHDQQVILVGARNGVHLLSADLTSIDGYGFKPPKPLRGGINAAVIFMKDRIFATHSEIGFIGWTIGVPTNADSPLLFPKSFEGAKAVRDLQVVDSCALYFSVDHKVITNVHLEDVTAELEYPPVEAETEITSLLVADGYVYTGLVNGAIQRWYAKSAETQPIVRPRTGDAVESIDWLEGGGVPRLLVADKRPIVELRVIGDSHITEYHAPQAIRWAWAVDHLITGINDRRDQLIIWEQCNPASPDGVIQVGRLCGHTIHDAAILS